MPRTLPLVSMSVLCLIAARSAVPAPVKYAVLAGSLILLFRFWFALAHNGSR